ncbi:MAG: hypothetical protein ABSH05_19930 [Bryobacteraceae bacterium]|jgi:hypothetical protein
MGVSRKGQKAEAAGTEKTVKKRRRTKAKLVSNVIKKIEEKLDADELKPTVGDLFRLLQLEKEMEQEQPKEIKVSWVEPDEKEHAPEK